MSFRALAIIACLALAQPAGASTQPADPLVDLFDRYCLGPDGDQVLTWTLAARSGLSPLSPDDFPGLRLPGIRQLRGFSGVVDGQDIRLLTGVNRWATPPARADEGANFHLCWVSARPASRQAVEAGTSDHLGVRRFRQGRALTFAWTVDGNDNRAPVRRSDFSKRFMALSREKGMRVVTVNEADGWVSIGYSRPVETCADWCY